MISIWKSVVQHFLFWLKFPPEFTFLKQDIGKFKYHTLKVLAVKDSIFLQLIGMQLWLDNTSVTILSTVYDFESQQEKSRQWSEKNTNARKTWAVFSDLQEKQMMILLSIDYYNHYMYGADIADQLYSYYVTRLISFHT